MIRNLGSSRFAILGVLLPLLLALGTLGCAVHGPQLRWQKITVSSEAGKQPLLSGPPQTMGMRSGRVVLRPGEVMPRHSTEGNEELLVLLAGRAHVQFDEGFVETGVGEVLYIPPQTWHEVRNPGEDELRYIYVVAPAR